MTNLANRRSSFDLPSSMKCLQLASRGLDALEFSDRAGSFGSISFQHHLLPIDLSVLRDRERTVLFEDDEMLVSFVGGDSSVEFARP